MRDRYPVRLSNRSDPFSRSNQADTAQVLAALNANNIPVFFQTKGGIGAIEAAEKQTRSVWYVSISFWDDAKRAEMEPGAPTIRERVELIQRLRSLGHEVLVGINPLVPAWLGDGYKPLLDTCAQIGVWGESKHSCCPANYPCFSFAEGATVDKWAGQELLLWRKAE